MQKIDLTGKIIDHLTVVREATKEERIDKTQVYYWCQCDCGNIIIVAEGDLAKHKKISCGCDAVKSKGESRIAELLTEQGIPFEQQKIFESCKFETNYPAYFDFFVDNKYLIEYDGEQHYYGWHGSENSLEKTKKRDEIKNLWCIENNIPLIRIPFTQLKFLKIEDLKLETSKFIYFTP